MHYRYVHISNIIRIIDDELLLGEKDIKEHHDPDMFGLIDKQEQLLGIGFTVCQTFLASVCQGKNKIKTLSLPPLHKCGHSYAEITNACANYWKHIEEWSEESIGRREGYVIDLLKKLDADVWADYPLSNAFYVLVGSEGKFEDLLSNLNSWSLEAEKM